MKNEKVTINLSLWRSHNFWDKIAEIILYHGWNRRRAFESRSHSFSHVPGLFSLTFQHCVFDSEGQRWHTVEKKKKDPTQRLKVKLSTRHPILAMQRSGSCRIHNFSEVKWTGINMVILTSPAMPVTLQLKSALGAVIGTLHAFSQWEHVKSREVETSVTCFSLYGSGSQNVYSHLTNCVFWVSAFPSGCVCGQSKCTRLHNSIFFSWNRSWKAR